MGGFKELAIIGTTASGKSALALELAQRFEAKILSLDSLAIYREIDIASAKPTSQELCAVKHYGIDVIAPDENFSVGEFFKIYELAKLEATLQDVPLIITGGSGFYLRSMLNGLSPDVPKCDVPSNTEIYALAERIDPTFAMKFSQNDSYRLEKWYQIYVHTNEVPSAWLAQNTSEPMIKNLDIFEILWQTSDLRERIKVRTKDMLQKGLLDEAQTLFARYGRTPKAFASIGLKECGQYFDGEISSIDELEMLISTHTAQLAKRQRTFNRSQFAKRAIGDIAQIRSAVAEILAR